MDASLVTIASPDGPVWSPFEEKVIRWVLANTSADRRWCAASAVRHINAAWRIRELDRTMSALRAITAEEEAARALLCQVKVQQYPGADALNLRLHGQKLTVWPVLWGVWKFVLPVGAPWKLPLRWAPRKSDGREILSLSIEIDGQFLTPTIPLDVVMLLDPIDRVHPEKRGQLDRLFVEFNLQLSEEVDARLGDHETLSVYTRNLADAVDARFKADTGYTAGEWVRNQHQLRSDLLYAKSEGLPRVVGDISSIITERKERVTAMLALICLMVPYDRARLVQQALNVFRLLVQQLPADQMEW